MQFLKFTSTVTDQEWIEENNRMDEEMEQQGYHAVKKQLYLSLTEDAEPYAQVGTVAAETNGIHATVVMRVEESDSDESSAFSVTAVLLMNGKPVDFRLDGNSSEGGILTVSLDSNRDYVMSLSAEDLPVTAGENKLILSGFGYSGNQDFYLNPCYTKGYSGDTGQKRTGSVYAAELFIRRRNDRFSVGSLWQLSDDLETGANHAFLPGQYEHPGNV